jgi:membrane dipeptidase
MIEHPTKPVAEVSTARRALIGTAAMGLAASAVQSLIGGAAVAASPPAAASNRRDLYVINSLGMMDDTYGGPLPPGVDRKSAQVMSQLAIDSALASGLVAVNFTLGGKNFEEAVAAIGRHDNFIRANSNKLTKIFTAEDIRQAGKQNKVGLIYGFQNTVELSDKAENVDVFADLGVRIIQLTYNPLNSVGGGSMAPGNPGLTPFGRQVVERLNARRIVVDLSHSGQQLCLDAARASKQPICITHTGCKAIASMPRNKTDEELRLVAEKGGYVGIFFIMYLAPGKVYDSSAVIAHIEHAIKVCGEDHVGIGSDYGITEPAGDLKARREFWANMVKRRWEDGSAAEGDDPNFLPYPTDMTGPNQFRVLADGLAKRGHPSSRIEKILGMNFLRYLGDTWGA